MIYRLIFSVLFFTSSHYVFGQEDFFELKRKADSLYYSGNNSEAFLTYKKLFSLKVDDKLKNSSKYNMAAVAALCKKKRVAFKYLNSIFSAKNKYKYLYQITYDELINDSSFILMWNTCKWRKTLRRVESNNVELNKGIDSSLILLILKLRDRDQVHRKKLYQTKKEFGDESKEVEYLYASMRKGDSLNIRVIDSIVNIHGWLGIDKVGYAGHYNFSLIIQHADTKTQLRYLPLLREKVKNNTVVSGILALLEDRVHLATEGVQLYGTQTCMDRETQEFYVCPIESPDSLDERRFLLGLSPFKTEAKRMRIEWDLEEYKRLLPKYRKIYKRDVDLNVEKL